MKGRKNRAAGGGMDSPASGDKDWEVDEKSKPERRVNAPKIEDAAEERKRGGRAKRKAGGKVKGADCAPRMDRKPRKAGGRAGSNASPLSSAHGGTQPKGHTTSGGKD